MLTHAHRAAQAAPADAGAGAASASPAESAPRPARPAARRRSQAADPGLTLYTLRDAIRRARDGIWQAGSVADLLGVAGDLNALSDAVERVARRRIRIGRR